MKKSMIILATAALLAGCEEKEDSAIKAADLIGRWRFSHKVVNGERQELARDQYCKLDQVYEFHADGTVTGNDPCSWNQFTETSANWKLVGDKLHIDYYALAGVSVNPVVTGLTDDELVLQQMYGDVTVTQNVFRRTTEDDLDYAGDAAGNYTGTLNYSLYYISNTFRGDSIPVAIAVKRKSWGNVSVEYPEMVVMGIPLTIRVDSVKTTRYENERRFYLEPAAGAGMLFINPDNIFNIRCTGNLGTTNSDSLYLRMSLSRVEFRDPANPSAGSVENIYQYLYFHGIKQ
jgi:hypothetical protein